MITNKDLSIDSKNGQVILNGDKYDLGTQGEIDAAVKDIYSVMGEMGAKNLIPYPYYETTKTSKGVTFTDNGDGTITVSGTASADATFDIRNIWLASDIVELLPNTIYAFSGCPVGGGTSTYSIQFGNEESDMSNKSWYDDIGTGGTLTTTDVKRFVGLRIIIKSGTAFSTPVTFKPMLRLASDIDDTYQPYAKTNRQLTEVIGDLSGTGVTGATVAAQLGVIGEILGFTHFVRIPYTTGVLESIEAAFENGTIPSDIMGLTIGMLRGGAGSQRVIFIAQNQSDTSTTQTRYAAIYFGSYTAPRFCQKQDGSAWTDVAL